MSLKFNHKGNLLISDQFNNRVIETNKRGEVVWSFGLGPTGPTGPAYVNQSVYGVNDAERVGKLTLMAGTGIPPGITGTYPAGIVDNRVMFVNKHGNIIWQYGQFGQIGTGANLLNVPVQCTYVPPSCHQYQHRQGGCRVFTGTVLITDQGNNRVIEVNDKKQIVWTFTAGNLSILNSAEKLENGNVLISDEGIPRAIEVNAQGVIVAIFTASGTLGPCAFASRLKNGNTLLTDAGNNRIVEVDAGDNIVWQYITDAEFNSNNPQPTRALRLKNGDTLISDQFNNRVITVSPENVIVGYYGLPLDNGNNIGYDIRTTQLGLFAPYDAKVIGDYTGITDPNININDE